MTKHQPTGNARHLVSYRPGFVFSKLPKSNTYVVYNEDTGEDIGTFAKNGTNGWSANGVLYQQQNYAALAIVEHHLGRSA